MIGYVYSEAQKQKINRAKEIYYSYVKLNGEYPLKGEIPEKLKNASTVFTVINADIQSCCTYLTVKDLVSGEIHSDCNSCWFNPVKSYFAVLRNEKVKIGESLEISRKLKLNDTEFEKVRTSKIIAQIMLTPTMLLLVTQNTVYFTEI